MGKSTNISITLPEVMLNDVDRACELEQRNRSELVRESLRYYLARIPTEEPMDEEIRALRRGRGEHRRGEYIGLRDLKEGLERDALATHRRQNRTTKSRKISA